MKKLILTTLVALLTFAGAMAQRPVTFRVEAAPLLNYGKMDLKNLDKVAQLLTDKKNRATAGYRVAVGADINLPGITYLNTGLTFALKGQSVSYGSADKDVLKVTNRVHYLQIPVNFGVKLGVSNALAVGFQAGPYFAVALAGKSTNTSNTPIIKEITSAKESFDIFKEGVLGLNKGSRFDVGIGVQSMLYFGRYYGTFGADLGLLNTIKQDTQNQTTTADKANAVLRNASYFLGVGITF